VINAYWHQRFQQGWGTAYRHLSISWSTPTGIKGFNSNILDLQIQCRNKWSTPTGIKGFNRRKHSAVAAIAMLWSTPTGIKGFNRWFGWTQMCKRELRDQRLLASKVSTANKKTLGCLRCGVINAYWHQRFQQRRHQSSIDTELIVINAYWHQRFQQRILIPSYQSCISVINAYWHQRFQQFNNIGNRQQLACDQRLLASKVSTERGLKTIPEKDWGSILQASSLMK